MTFFLLLLSRYNGIYTENKHKNTLFIIFFFDLLKVLDVWVYNLGVEPLSPGASMPAVCYDARQRGVTLRPPEISLSPLAYSLFNLLPGL